MTEHSNKRVTVFLVEDDPYMQTVLRGCLSKYFSAFIYQNPVEVLGAMQQGNVPDLVISDLNLPRMTGLQFLKQMQNSGFLSTIPVVMLSGTEDTNTRIECLEAGADDFIVKPFNLRELTARLHNILKRSGKLAATNF